MAVGTFAGATFGGMGATGAVAGAVPSSTSVVFDEPGVFHWTVPAGVRWATFDLSGAAGGGSEGGGGARVTATVAVRPKTVLTIVVGGQGGDPAGIVAGPGGFGGGAVGGAGSQTLHFGEFTLPGGPGGGGGGGASDVRTGDEDDLGSRLLVASGGGGGSDAPGGAGSTDGEPGGDGVITYNFPDAFPPVVVPGGGGGRGALGTGVVGQDAPPTRLDFVVGRPIVTTGGVGGGGGGGGLFGGGGGASAADGQIGILFWEGTSAGGGGGSSLVAPDAACTPVVEPGVSLGDGSVVVTFRHGNARPRCDS